SKKMVSPFREHAALQPLPQHVRRKDVRHALQKIARVRFSFYPHADFAQALDPTPHRLARNADLSCDARSADRDRRVVRKQCKQGSQPPVSGAGKGSGSKKGTDDYCRYIEW